jgi:26S proteasome regulatory subunit N11
MEVMGLMLGEFVDDYTVRVIDVFAMPQSGTGVSVEAVDPVFQTKMLDMLKQTGRYVLIIGTLDVTWQPLTNNYSIVDQRW